MSIKDLFSKSKVAIYESAESASVDLESADFLQKKVEQNNTFIPFLDFSDPSLFIKFGSAELYYDNSIKRVHQQYPYDGSGKEKIEYHLSSSYLDQWLYDNKYPKSTGYAIMTAGGYGSSTMTDGYGLGTQEYIYAAGGLHTASAGMFSGELYKNFDKSIKYNADKNRTQNFRVNPVAGTTVEFWLNKDTFITGSTQKEVILDLWNSELSSSANYGRLTIYIEGTADGLGPIKATLQNGTTGFVDQSLGATSFTTSSIADGNWHHYAVSFLSQSAGIKSFFYVDGDLNNEQTIGSVGISELPGRINAHIGALQTSPSGSAAPAYAGKLSGSIDEFRFWKTRRTSKQINLNWYRPIDGGANTEDNNTPLGCYFKFNEGITGTTSVDNVVLDYSGRLANGAWTGYASGARNTGSCFVSASVLSAEPLDPILYSTHSLVAALQTEMALSGSDYDQINTTFLYKKLPQFMRDEDEKNAEDIKKLFQIISSYFDTLYSQMKVIPELTNKNYLSSSTKPLPFSNRLLESRGFATSELFVDTDILEFYGNNDYENIKFDDNVNDIKNLIYHNIYNNLDYIYKTKGSEKSFRNLLRCFGIDDELVKFNVYTDGGTHYFNDNFKDTSVTAKYINYNNPAYFTASVYQTSSANHSISYISGSSAEKLEKYNAFTFEIDTIIPEKLPPTEPAFFETSFLSASIGGFHQATTDYNWVPQEIANAEIYLIRDEKESNRAKFLLTNQDGTLFLTSSYYDEIYDNERWVLATRVKPTGYPIIGSMLTSSNPTYEISFYGVNHEFGEVKNEFAISASLNYTSGSSYMSEPKRVYIGAHRTNFTGSVLTNTDIQVGSCRFWMDYLSNTDIKAHSKDITNLGVDNSTRNGTLFATNLTATPIPRADLLALNWDFDLVTGSSGGSFSVIDSSSGSLDTIYGWIDNIVRREHDGASVGFGDTATGFMDKELVYASKKELPEISVTSNNIFIKDDKQEFFIKDDDVSDNFYSLEKSMYQIISEDMLSMFASAVEFNTLIGQAADRYRHKYKHLDKMRQLYFQKVQSDMDFDRFTDYYKWIDSAISEMMNQLYPASVRHSDSIANMVESHILERNKYQNKFPLTTRLASTEGSARGAGELIYNWKFGHAPVGGTENENCLWNKERKERSDIADRETIRKSINNNNNAPAPLLFKPDGISYQGSTFAINHLSKPYRESISLNSPIHGGINYSENKDRDFVHNATYIHGPVSQQYPKGIPQNVLVVGLGEGQGTDAFIDCADVENPNEKRKWRFSAVLGRAATGLNPSAREGKDYEYKVKSSIYWPNNVISGTVTSGYNKRVVETFKSGTIITNVHSDTFSPTNDIGMQGPFTEAWVGGHQSRHVNLNSINALTDAYSVNLNNLDNAYSRPEAWRLLLKECTDDPVHGSGSVSGSNDGAMGFVGPDYGGPYPDYTRKYAVRYRDERTKRPINLKNIRTTTGSVVFGNFTENYEVIHTFGAKGNNLILKNETGSLLPLTTTTQLPQTTNYQTLVAQTTGSEGNVFGDIAAQYSDTIYVPAGSNNRQYLNYGQAQVIGSIATRGSAFRLPPFETITDGDFLKLNNSAGATVPFEINTSVQGGGVTIQTGSSNTLFWNNVTSSLNSNGYANTTYETSGGVTSTSLQIDGVLASTRITDLQVQNSHLLANASNDGDYAWSGWLFYPVTQQSGIERTVWSLIDTDNNNVKSNMYFNNNGTVLNISIGAVGSVGQYLNKIWQYSPGGDWKNVYGDQWVHLSVAFRSQSVPDASSVAVYVNTASVTADVSPSFIGVTRQHSASHNTRMFIGHNGVGGTTTSVNKQFTGSLDQSAFVTGSLLTADIASLYNYGYAVDTHQSASSIAAAWLFGGSGSVGTDFTNAEITNIHDQTGNGFNVTGGILPTSTIQYFINEVSAGGVGTVANIVTPTIATFNITSSGESAGYNRTIQTTGTSFVINGVRSTSGFFTLGSISGGVTPVAEIPTRTNITTIQRDDLKSSRSIIKTRFSAPGGPEINTRGFLDIGSQEFSAYNALPYRNLTVLGSGSGENNRIRVDSPSARREGLRTLLARHCGRHGLDSQYGQVSSENYTSEASFEKINRNTRVIVETGSLIITESFDNSFVSRPIPSQDYGYSWVTASLGEELAVRTAKKQLVFGYWPKDGILSASADVDWRINGFDSAVNFPTGSQHFRGYTI